MADIAAIFHWPLSEISALSLDELILWRSLAVASWNRMWAVKEGDA
jgi:hypothetical protein